MVRKLISYSVLCLFFFSSCNQDDEIISEKEPCIDRELINESAVCYLIYAPVCGCDNKTYSNDCIAKNNGVLNYKNGTCDN